MYKTAQYAYCPKDDPGRGGVGGWKLACISPKPWALAQGCLYLEEEAPFFL